MEIEKFLTRRVGWKEFPIKTVSKSAGTFVVVGSYFVDATNANRNDWLTIYKSGRLWDELLKEEQSNSLYCFVSNLGRDTHSIPFRILKYRSNLGEGDVSIGKVLQKKGCLRSVIIDRNWVTLRAFAVEPNNADMWCFPIRIKT